MATYRLIPSTYYRSNATYTSVTNDTNMYTNTDSTTYAQLNNTRNSTSNTYYIYIRGFDFNTVPTTATVNSFTVKIKMAVTNLSESSSSYRPSLYNGTTSISNTAISSTPSATVNTYSFAIPTSLSWATLKGYGANFGIRVPLRRSSTSSSSYASVYGAEIEVTTAETVHVTGVSLNKNSTSLEEGATEQLTATVTPSNATDQSVSWSSNNTSVATVNSSGQITAVSAGTATITVTTTDGGYTDTCTVTVTAPTYTQYRVVTTMEAGKSYLIGNGESGTIYLLSNEANGSRTLKGIAVTATNGIISITGSVASKALFSCVETSPGNVITTGLSIGGQYLYCDNANGLRMNTVGTLDRFWHYVDNKFWQFKNSSSNGYTDASSEYKYYLSWSNGNATDAHVDTTSIADSNIPLTYLYAEYIPTDNTLYTKINGNWAEVLQGYKKVNGTWVEQDITTLFNSTDHFVKGV